jgi:hypothetical protein
MNYPTASRGVSKTLNCVVPHLMRNDELAASGGDTTRKELKNQKLEINLIGHMMLKLLHRLLWKIRGFFGHR